jgi:hypothetical protein
MKVFVFLLLLVLSANAFDWVYFFGKEPKGYMNNGTFVPNDQTPAILAFLQPQYTNNRGDTMINGTGQNITPFSYNAPYVKEQSTASIFRAKLGLRGSFDQAGLCSYIVLTEFGKNGVRAPLKQFQKDMHLTDISLTYHAHRMANVRIGRFYKRV